MKFVLFCLAVLACATATTLYPTSVVSDSSAIASELFGETVAISGSLVAVGAPQRGSNNQGAVLLYNCPTLSTCTFVNTIVAPDAADEDQFGFSVAFDGNTLIVGAPFKTVNGNQFEGSAYIFTCTANGCVGGTAITQSAGSGAQFDDFGTAVAISGNLVAIGCDQKTVNTNVGQGSVFVYSCNLGSCTLFDTIQCPDCSGGGENFGKAVAVNGNMVAIGAPFRTVNGNGQQGEGYVFDCSNNPCIQVGVAMPNDGAAGDNLGTSVGISGTTAVFGAPSATVSAQSQGAAYVYTCSGNSCNLDDKLVAADGMAGDNFGFAVAVDGVRVVIGANMRQVGAVNSSGIAYLYDCSTITGCTNQRELAFPSYSTTGDNAGFAVDLDNSVLGVVIGAPYYSSGSNTQVGRIALFSETGISCAAVVYNHASYPMANPGQAVHGVCGNGYYGNPYRTCQSNGQFGAETNPCQPNPGCPATTYAFYDWPSGTVGQSAVGTCTTGYAGPTGTRLCMASGWATAVSGSCIAGCPAETDNNANWTVTANGQQVYGTCVSGYYGRPYRSCQNGVWGPITNPCQPIGSGCGPITTGFNSFAGAQALQTVTGTCAPHTGPLTGTGFPSRKCIGNDVWASYIANVCVTLQCPATVAGNANFPKTNSGAFATGTCISGTGHVTMQCVAQSATSVVWGTPSGVCQ